MGYDKCFQVDIFGSVPENKEVLFRLGKEGGAMPYSIFHSVGIQETARQEVEAEGWQVIVFFPFIFEWCEGWWIFIESGKKFHDLIQE